MRTGLPLAYSASNALCQTSAASRILRSYALRCGWVAAVDGEAGCTEGPIGPRSPKGPPCLNDFTPMARASSRSSSVEESEEESGGSFNEDVSVSTGVVGAYGVVYLGASICMAAAWSSGPRLSSRPRLTNRLSESSGSRFRFFVPVGRTSSMPSSDFSEPGERAGSASEAPEASQRFASLRQPAIAATTSARASTPLFSDMSGSIGSNRSNIDMFANPFANLCRSTLPRSSLQSVRTNSKNSGEKLPRLSL